MDDRQFTVTLAKEDWDLVLTALEICKENASSLMEHEIDGARNRMRYPRNKVGFRQSRFLKVEE